MDHQEILQLLVSQEELAGKLYQTYKELFPGINLWTKLVKDESTHANWLRALSGESKAIFDKKRFPVDAIKSMLNYEQVTISEASSHDLLKALSIAYDIEQSLIEKNSIPDSFNEFFIP